MNLQILPLTKPVDLTKWILARDSSGNIKLQCTRNFESRGLMLRVRALRLTAEGHLTDRPILMSAACDRDTPKESWLRYMDTMVDVVRLQYPGHGFAPFRSNYHGPRPK